MRLHIQSCLYYGRGFCKEGSAMNKKIKNLIKASIMTMLILAVLPFAQAKAEERVICEVNFLSEYSAAIKLKWNNTTKTTPIKINSWKIEENKVLRIVYEQGTDIASGWNERIIEGSQYAFPTKIVLEEKGKGVTSFPDMPENTEAKNSILNLYFRGIIGGYEDGSFKPLKNVTRAEFSKMLVSTAEYKLSSSKSEFADVSEGYWAKPFIMTLAQKSILKGRAPGSFDPEGNITIGEAVAIIYRSFVFYNQNQVYPYNLSNHWSNNEFVEMVSSGLVKKTDAYYYPYTPDKKATRQECAILLSRVLEQAHQKK